MRSLFFHFKVGGYTYLKYTLSYSEKETLCYIAVHHSCKYKKYFNSKSWKAFQVISESVSQIWLGASKIKHQNIYL